MNSCCTLFHIDPTSLEQSPVQLDETACSSSNCNCGYITYESLIPYMTELTNEFTQDDDHLFLEAKLRQQIVEVSRFFDLETRVDDGFYSKAHEKILELQGNGTRYMRIDPFVEGTLELYTKDNYLIDPQTYTYKNGYLIFQPCVTHDGVCGCTESCNDCGSFSQGVISNIGWKGCYKAKAKFGKECADYAVQLAVRAYIIEFNSYGDVKETDFQGLPINRGFKVPHVWTQSVKKKLKERRFDNIIAIA